MKKILHLIDVLDEKELDKLIYLERLVKLYSRFMHTWKAAEVRSDGKAVRVKFFTVSKYGYESFTEREFPMEDVGKRITSYKGKIKREFVKRHDNPRIARSQKIYQWKKYLKECQDSDATPKDVKNTEK